MNEEKRCMMSEADEEHKRKAEERERVRLEKEERKGRRYKESWGVYHEMFIASCPHCGLHISKTITSGLDYYYCKRCNELQIVTTKKVVETVVEREHRGFWQWFLHKPASIRRAVHAEIVDCKPTCHICKRTDMMVPFEKKHCPVCGAVLLT